MQALASLAAAATTQEAKTMFRRMRRNIVLYGLAGLFGLTAYAIALLAGVYSVWLLSGSFLEASLYTALGFAIAAAVPFAAIKIMNWRERKRLARLRQTRMLALTAAAGLLPRIFGSKTGIAAAAAGALAFYIMNRPSGDGDGGA